MPLTDYRVEECCDDSTGFQGAGKVYSSSPRQTRHAIAVSFFVLFLALFFAGPQFGSLDADMDGVAEVPVIGAISVCPFEVRDTDTPAAVRTPQFVPAYAADLTASVHPVAPNSSLWLPPAEQGFSSLRC